MRNSEKSWSWKSDYNATAAAGLSVTVLSLCVEIATDPTVKEPLAEILGGSALVGVAGFGMRAYRNRQHSLSEHEGE